MKMRIHSQRVQTLSGKLHPSAFYAEKFELFKEKYFAIEVIAGSGSAHTKAKTFEFRLTPTTTHSKR